MRSNVSRPSWTVWWLCTSPPVECLFAFLFFLFKISLGGFFFFPFFWTQMKEKFIARKTRNSQIVFGWVWVLWVWKEDTIQDGGCFSLQFHESTWTLQRVLMEWCFSAANRFQNWWIIPWIVTLPVVLSDIRQAWQQPAIGCAQKPTIGALCGPTSYLLFREFGLNADS